MLCCHYCDAQGEAANPGEDVHHFSYLAVAVAVMLLQYPLWFSIVCTVLLLGRYSSISAISKSQIFDIVEDHRTALYLPLLLYPLITQVLHCNHPYIQSLTQLKAFRLQLIISTSVSHTLIQLPCCHATNLTTST